VEAFANSLRGEVKRLGVDVGVGYFFFIDTDMVKGSDSHPALGRIRQETPGPLGRTYPVSAVGQAVADGIEARRRRIVVPGWARSILMLRTAVLPILERLSYDRAAEADQLFQQDVETRGVEAASAPLGAGGEAAREREPAGSA
jgi:short-subunit dehydrogenase